MGGERERQSGGEHDAQEQAPEPQGGGDLKHAAMQRRQRERKDSGGGKVTDLGMLEKPGTKLAGSTHELAPGDSLRFSDGENQIWGLGEITVEPPHLATMDNKELENYKDHVLGSMSKHQYTLKVAADAKAGDKINVKCAGDFQSRNDPGWAFSFKVVVK